jgi:Kdo2-lipid IVA lauroyltransferase/acyltransferase
MDLSVFLQNGINISCARVLPLAFFRPFIYAQGILYYSIHEEEFHHTIKALRWVFRPESKKAGFYLRVAKTFAGVFEHYLEKLITAYRPLEQMMSFMKTSVMIKDKKRLDEAISAGMGCLLVSGHFGAVEFFPLTLAVNGYRTAMIVSYKTPGLKKALLSRAVLSNVTLIDSNESNAFAMAMNALRKGMILVTVCDEFKHWKPDPNRNTSIFGCAYPQDKTLDIFCKRVKVPVFLGLIKREKTGYSLHIQPVVDGKNMENVCAKAWKSLENQILSDPEQWYNWQEFSRVVLKPAGQRLP